MFSKIGRSVLVMALAGICSVALAQEKASSSKSTRSKSSSSASKSSSSKTSAAKEEKGISGRLPRYFAAIVDDKQREEIYEIRASFREKVEKLEAELKSLKEDEMKAMEKVLSTTQRRKLTTARNASEKSSSSKTTSSSRSTKAKTASTRTKK